MPWEVKKNKQTKRITKEKWRDKVSPADADVAGVIKVSLVTLCTSLRDVAELFWPIEFFSVVRDLKVFMIDRLNR